MLPAAATLSAIAAAAKNSTVTTTAGMETASHSEGKATTPRAEPSATSHVPVLLGTSLPKKTSTATRSSKRTPTSKRKAGDDLVAEPAAATSSSMRQQAAPGKKPKPPQVINIDIDEDDTVDDHTDYPPPASAEYVKQKLVLMRNRSKESYTYQPGQMVVYSEGEYQEDHRAAVVQEVLSESRVRLRFQLVGSGLYEFNGNTRVVNPGLCYRLKEYGLNKGRRFSYFGPPPRLGGLQQTTIATMCEDVGQTVAPVVRVQVLDTVQMPVHQHVINGLVLGFMQSVGVAYEFRILIVVHYENEDLVQVLKKPNEIPRRLGCCMTKDFFSQFLYHDYQRPGRILPSDDQLSDTESDRVQALLMSMEFVERCLAEDRTWKPKPLRRVVDDCVLARKPVTATSSSSTPAGNTATSKATSSSAQAPAKVPSELSTVKVSLLIVLSLVTKVNANYQIC